MRHIIKHVKHRASVVRSIATKRVILSFTNDFGMVYFGHVNQHSDEHELVRGITVSAAHHDRHYSVGSIQGYDVSLVQRSDTLHLPGSESVAHTWLIMQIDLHVDEKMFPHILLDTKHHNQTFYAKLRMTHQRLKQIDSALFAGHDATFMKYFTMYASHEHLNHLPYVLTPEVTATLGQHFRQFDFEIHNDKLYVYASNMATTRKQLDDMARVGIWFAQHLDAIAPHIRLLES